MLTNECERDIQLELNRNYLKSFPARLKFCHIVSISEFIDMCIGFFSSEFLINIFFSIVIYTVPMYIGFRITVLLHTKCLFTNAYSDLHWNYPCPMFTRFPGVIHNQLENNWKNSNGTNQLCKFKKLYPIE